MLNILCYTVLLAQFLKIKLSCWPCTNPAGYIHSCAVFVILSSESPHHVHAQSVMSLILEGRRLFVHYNIYNPQVRNASFDGTSSANSTLQDSRKSSAGGLSNVCGLTVDSASSTLPLIHSPGKPSYFVAFKKCFMLLLILRSSPDRNSTWDDQVRSFYRRSDFLWLQCEIQLTIPSSWHLGILIMRWWSPPWCFDLRLNILLQEKCHHMGGLRAQKMTTTTLYHP